MQESSCHDTLNYHHLTELFSGMRNGTLTGLWEISLTTQNTEIIVHVESLHKFCVWGKTFTEAKGTLTKASWTTTLTLEHCTKLLIVTAHLQLGSKFRDFAVIPRGTKISCQIMHTCMSAQCQGVPKWLLTIPNKTYQRHRHHRKLIFFYSTIEDAIILRMHK